MGTYIRWPATGGTVTSIALTVPAEFSVSGSPVTTTGTFAVSKATQTANYVWAGPTTGSAATPAFRALVVADVPTLTTTKITAPGTSAVYVKGDWSTASAVPQADVTGLVSALAGKQATITTGTTAQYFKGDLSLGTLNQAAVAGLTTADSPTHAGLTLTGFSGVVKAAAGVFSAATIVNADVSSSAAIAYSKLALTGAILNGDLAGSIATSKITAPGASSVYVKGDWSTSSAIPQADVTGLVSALAGKQATITTGTTAQYFKGDLSLGTLNQAAVAGLTTADSPTFANVTASTKLISSKVGSTAGTFTVEVLGANTYTLTQNGTTTQSATSGGAHTIGPSTANVAHTVQGGSVLSGASAAAQFSPLINGGAYTVADNGTASIATSGFNGLIIVTDTQLAAVAIYALRGGGNATVELADASTKFSTTKDTANSYNIYWESGTSRYTIQNKGTGASTTFMVFGVCTYNNTTNSLLL